MTDSGDNDLVYEAGPYNPLVCLSLIYPFLHRLAEAIPNNIHPNVLTLGTLVIACSTFIIQTYYDYYLLASSWFYPEHHSMPNWVWLYSGIGIMLEYILDTLDGYHARRTGTASPVGEFLDHATDTIRLSLIHPLSFFALFSRYDFGLEPTVMFYTVLQLQISIFLMFWFQRVTGVLTVPWNYDFNHWFFALFNIWTWIRGGSTWWKHRPFFGLSNAEIQCAGFWVCCLGLAIPLQICHFVWAYKEKKARISTRHIWHILWFVLAICCSLAWFKLSPKLNNSMLYIDPRLFLTAHSVTFSDIASRLIYERLSRKQQCLNVLVILYVAVTIIFICLPAKLLRAQWILLVSYTGIAVLSHAFFCYRCVRSLSATSGSSVFTVPARSSYQSSERLHTKVD